MKIKTLQNNFNAFQRLVEQHSGVAINFAQNNITTQIQNIHVWVDRCQETGLNVGFL